MREIRSYGSEGGGAVSSPYPYQTGFPHDFPLDPEVGDHTGREPRPLLASLD